MAETYQGDLEKTRALFALLEVPQDNRSEEWQANFLGCIGEASFRCGDPQVIKGPDGFPYFQLFLPEPGKPFQCFVINKMKDDFLLENGYGVVINPSGTGVDWVLSSGDILNYHLSKKFYTTEPTDFASGNEDETLTGNEEVMIGQPSENLLPAVARKRLRSLFVANGIENPKVLLMMRRQKDGSGVSQDLVFNAIPPMFSSEDKFRSTMRAISWYLPRHYSVVGMSENSMGDGLQDL